MVMLTCRDQQAAAYKGSRKTKCVVLFSILHNKFFKTLLTIFTYSGIFLVNPTDFVDCSKTIHKMWSCSF